MPKRLLILVVLLGVLLALIGPAAAQDGPQPERVELIASDGWTLVGNYYAPPDDAVGDSGAPAILLLHQANSRKEAWYDIAPVLNEAGYAVLAIDQRGGGETRGSMTADNSESDVLEWLAWLREQPGVDPARLNLMGGSMGANLALLGMAGDPDVVTAIALSPGTSGGYAAWDLTDVFDAIGDRPVFLAAGQRDDPAGPDTKALFMQATNYVQLRMYPHSAHGTGLFMLEDDLLPAIILWLDAHNG